MNDRSWNRRVLSRNAAQFLVFGLVGASNTIVDFGVTNLLYALTRTDTRLGLLAISVTACLVATANSYLLNRRFTFRQAARRPDPGAPLKFGLVALLSLVINTSVFLFFARYLPERFGLHPVVALNAAKALGVMTALAVSFLGYRFGVFQTEAVARFRRGFAFERAGRSGFAAQALWLVAAAALVRVGYLFLTTAIGGDAVNYAGVSQGIAAGRFANVDAFWHSLFTFWQALFHLLPVGKVTAVALSTLVPGVLLLLPVVWMARTLYGPTVAWIAGLFTVLHPRLVEYSANGYAESLYLLLFAAAAAFLMKAYERRSWVAPALAGLAFGLYACTRSEGLAAFLLALPVGALAGWLRNRSARAETSPAASTDPARIPVAAPISPGRGRSWIEAAAVPGVMIAGFAVVMLLYAGLSLATFQSPGLFQKTSNLAKQFSEQLDPRQAARETYGSEGALFGAEKTRPPLTEVVGVLARRYPRNVLYSLERLPGILLSPVVFFLLLLPFFVSWRRQGGWREAPLGVMFFFPLLFYPLIQVEPRLFMSMLVPIHIFGAAGLVAFTTYAASRISLGRAPALAAGVAAILLFTTAVTVWRGLDLEKKYRFQRETAAWIAGHVPEDELLVGCGYGYISTTGFLSERTGCPRVWTADPARLASFADQHHARWLVLYEPFLRMANPELLPCLDRGVPGFERMHEVRDHQGRRIQILRRRPATGPTPAPLPASVS